MKVKVHTHGHYGEPPLDCEITANKRNGWLPSLQLITVCHPPVTQVQLQIEYNPFNGQWTTSPLDQLAEQLAAATLL